MYNKTNAKSAPEEYLYNRIYNLPPGIDNIGAPQGELVGCLALAWLLVFGCICRGIKSSGKVVYFTATFPYVSNYFNLISIKLKRPLQTDHNVCHMVGYLIEINSHGRIYIFRYFVNTFPLGGLGGGRYISRNYVAQWIIVLDYKYK